MSDATPMAESPLRIVSFSLTQRRAWLNDHREVPITNMFVFDGEENVPTDDPDEAEIFVAGSDEISWFSVVIAEFDVAQLQ